MLRGLPATSGSVVEDLGRVRDALALEERGAVKQLEQDAIDCDKADQMRVAEEHLAEALRVEQKALRARNRRRHALRQAAYGAEALFGERGDLGLALQQTQLPAPVAHASVSVDA